MQPEHTPKFPPVPEPFDELEAFELDDTRSDDAINDGEFFDADFFK